MRKLFLFSASILLSVVIFYSCKKNDNAPLTEDQAAANLVKSDNFIEFSKRFIPDYVNLASYHRQLKVQGNDRVFVNMVTEAGNDEAKISDAYSRFSLDYEAVMVLKNHVDNDLLTLFHQNPFLLNFNEAAVGRILVKAMESGLFSNDPKWLEAKKEMNLSLHNINPPKIAGTSKTTNAVGLNFAAAPSELTGDEVWGCVKEAVGIGGASVLGIGALQKLAQEGIQAAVVTLSKWLAKRAGWIGAAIMLIDFADCVYKEAND